MCPWASHFTIQNLSFVIKGVVISRPEADWVVTIVAVMAMGSIVQCEGSTRGELTVVSIEVEL